MSLVDAMLARHASAVHMQVWTIIVAAGAGTRFGGPKLLERLGGESVLDRSVSTALAATSGVVVVLAAESRSELAPSFEGRGCRVVAGASTRSGSVRAGLDAIPEEIPIIAVHDGARPLAGAVIYQRGIEAVAAGADGAVPVVPVVDTIRQVGGGVVDRSGLRAVQTPQVFGAEILRRAHESGDDATDDAALVEGVGGKVVLVDGSRDNIKITEPLDLAIVRGIAGP
jgi:2-C-methyl-D-erythritol 4-phosphate cytidylyltransferase